MSVAEVVVPPDPAEWRERVQRADRRAASRRRTLRVLRFVAALLWFLPRPVALHVGAMAGLLHWATRPALRRVAARNLDRALGDTLDAARRRTLVRRVFVQSGRSAAEILAVRRTGIAAVEPFVAVEGEEHLAAALAAGRGVLLVTAHYGNFELMAGLLARRMRLRVVGRPTRGDDAEGFLHAMRARHGVETIPQGQPRAVLRSLKEGWVVGLLPDQDLDQQPGIFVPFFGHSAYTVTGPASLAMAAGAPLLPAYLRREGGDRHRLVFLPPIAPDPDAEDREAEVRRLTVAWSDAMERWIREEPSQWVWFHRRWRTTPASLIEARESRARGKVVRLRPVAEV